MTIKWSNNLFKVIKCIVIQIVSTEFNLHFKSLFLFLWLQNWENIETVSEIKAFSFMAICLRFYFFQEAICNWENEVGGRWLCSSHDCRRDGAGLPACWPPTTSLLLYVELWAHLCCQRVCHTHYVYMHTRNKVIESNQVKAGNERTCLRQCYSKTCIYMQLISNPISPLPPAIFF